MRSLAWLAVAAVAAAGVVEPASRRADQGQRAGLAATLLPLGQATPGSLSHLGDVEAFRLDLTAAARVEVRSTGGTDTRGRLLDGSAVVIAEDDDSGPGGHNFRMVAPLEPGVYYVEVWGAAGDYRVEARLADSLDQGDTASSSTLLTLHEGTAATPDIGLGASGRIWPSSADVDVFRVDVPQDGTEVTVRSSGSAPLHARLLDSSLAEVASHDGGDGGVDITTQLDAGAYYVMVGAEEVGTYRLLATGEPTADPCAEPALVRDDGRSPESSTLVALGGPPVAGTIGDDADVDVFRLDLVGETLLEVRTSGTTDTRGELYDSSGMLIASDEASGPGGHNFRIVADLAAGNYYATVRGAPGARGQYAVTARRAARSDHADVAWTSTRLALHDADDLARVAPDMLLGTAGRIWPKTDEDVFRLDVAREGTVVKLRTSGGTPLYARLLHAGERLVEVASDDRDGNINIEVPLDPGVYYLRIGGHDTGAYRVLAYGYQAGFAPPHRAAFDAFALGKSLLGPSIETVDFRSARRFAGPMGEASRAGGYVYDRGACPHTGWLRLEYDDGPRCSARLSFISADTGTAAFSCDDGTTETSAFAILDGNARARIPDERLAAAIRRALGAPFKPVTLADLASLRELTADRVADLDGLDRAIKLTSLTLTQGLIRDLSPLAGLQSLTTLHLERNRISDLRPLAGLTALETLRLSVNRIADIEPLAGLQSLTTLHLESNRISDLQPLSGLTGLTDLVLARNAVSDLWPLASLVRLTALRLRDNGISNLGPLAGLWALDLLDVSDNEVADVGPLAGLGNLRHLQLRRNQVSDLGPLAGLTRLISLGLSGNAVSDLWPLAGLVGLFSLELAHNEISDLRPLAGLELYQLGLQGNRITDLSPLSHLTHDAHDRRPGRVVNGRRFGPPSVRLDLSDNDIADVGPLSGLTFAVLDLSYNEISDLSPFATMSLAEHYDYPEIRLQGNRIADLSPLHSLSRSTLHLAWEGTLDLGHNSLAGDLYGLEYLAANTDLAGNRLASLGSLATPNYSLNVEGNDFTTVPLAKPYPEDLAVLWLGGNLIHDVAPLLDHANYFGRPRVSLWRNPLSATARANQLPEVNLWGIGQLVPLLVNSSTSQHAGRQGVLRLANPGSVGDAWLYAPRLGADARPAAVVVPHGAVRIDAGDMRWGARDKRVYGHLPIGSGDAALEVFSARCMVASAYVRTGDGFLTSMHDTSPHEFARYVVPIFNPASDSRQVSLLRLVNTASDDARVSVTGVDDAGMKGGPVGLVVPARTATVLDAGALESGSRSGLSGSLGDGEGRWRLEVWSDTNIAVMNLLETPTGHLTNLSTSALTWSDLRTTVPLFLSASHRGAKSWVRVANQLYGPRLVEIVGTDDAGRVAGPVAVHLARGHVLEFNSDDWENGNASKGLGRGVGPGTGHWRLHIRGGRVGAYVETEDGFLSSMHDRVLSVRRGLRYEYPRPCAEALGPVSTATYSVAPFMPAKGVGPVSSLRLLNDGRNATVTISGFDERGNRSGTVYVELAAGTGRTLTARELASGGEGLTGRLRVGAGMWELRVTSSNTHVTVVNLLEDASGRITNLSPARYHPVVETYR